MSSSVSFSSISRSTTRQTVYIKFLKIDLKFTLGSIIADTSPALVLWFFDSRGQHLSASLSFIFLNNTNPGGFSPNPNSVAVPDWVDASVGEWIKSETAAMEAAWGPADSRAAIAFVHIPP